MNALAATESDLPQRIRRILRGGAPRMGTRTRVLAAALLFPLAAVTLPSWGAASELFPVADEPRRDGFLFMVVYQDCSMKLDHQPVTLETLGEQLQAKQQMLGNPRIVIQHDERAPGGQITGVIDIVQQAGLVMLGYPVVARDSRSEPLSWAAKVPANIASCGTGGTMRAASSGAASTSASSRPTRGRGGRRRYCSDSHSEAAPIRT